MAKGYRRVDRDQVFLLPPDMRDWLPEDHPVHWVIAAVAGLDTSKLHAMRRTGGVGRQGYDPDMMLTLLIWAWAQGARSSRLIERLCAQDLAYRFICAGNLPDHSVISRFRQAAAPVIEDLFAQVLLLCARLGMVRVGVIALDGTKIGADASIDASLTEDGLVAAAAREAAKTAAAEHAAADEGEDDLFGPGGRGDTVADDPGTPSGRAERIAQALAGVQAQQQARAERIAQALAKVQVEQQARADAQAEVQARRRARPASLVGHFAGPPTAAQIALAETKLERATADQLAKIGRWETARAAGSGPKGRPPSPLERARDVVRYTRILAEFKAYVDRSEPPPARPGRPRRQPAADTRRPPIGNITDPDSHLQPTRKGWIQGYNCQAVASRDGFILATSVSAHSSDGRTYQPSVTAAVAAAAAMVPHRPPDFPTADTRVGLVLADAGYLSADNLTAAGPDRLIAVGKHRDLERRHRARTVDPPPPGRSEPIAAMAERLRTDAGIASYRQRGPIIETVFGQTKHNNGFRRFTRRGINPVTAEWTFNGLVHNLMKAHRLSTT